MIEVVEGDILLSDRDIIVHQVNCINVMGGGIAKAIAERYLNVKREYYKYVRSFKDSSELLGNVQFVDTYDDKIVANVFGQEFIRSSPRDKKVYTVTDALLNGLRQVKALAEKNNYTIAIPYGIGCGMANGDWNEIRPAIEELFDGCDFVTFYRL